MLELAGLSSLARVITTAMRLVLGCVVPATTQIGSGTYFSYGGLGVVLHKHATIGEGCLISQHVTIGGAGGYGYRSEGAPTLGNRVYVGAGAKIIGPVTIGDDAMIGANAVVTKSVPPMVVVAGVPARPITSSSSALALAKRHGTSGEHEPKP